MNQKSTALAVAGTKAIANAPAGLSVNSIEEANRMAEMLAASSLVPDHFRGKPSDCFMAIAYGIELGMPPVTSLASIAVVKGKPTLFAATMVALVMRSGLAEYFRCVESDGKVAVYETLRTGTDKPRQYSFSQDDAKAAGLAGGMYNKYPRQMLEARAKSYLCRDVYPDVLHGLQSYEEVTEMVEPRAGVDVAQFSDPAEVKDAEVEEAVAQDSDEVSPLDQILGCQTREELEGLKPALAKLTGKDREDALKLYKEQLATISKFEEGK